MSERRENYRKWSIKWTDEWNKRSSSVCRPLSGGTTNQTEKNFTYFTINWRFKKFWLVLYEQSNKTEKLNSSKYFHVFYSEFYLNKLQLCLLNTVAITNKFVFESVSDWNNRLHRCSWQMLDTESMSGQLWDADVRCLTNSVLPKKLPTPYKCYNNLDDRWWRRKMLQTR